MNMRMFNMLLLKNKWIKQGRPALDSDPNNWVSHGLHAAGNVLGDAQGGSRSALARSQETVQLHHYSDGETKAQRRQGRSPRPLLNMGADVGQSHGDPVLTSHPHQWVDSNDGSETHDPLIQVSSS